MGSFSNYLELEILDHIFGKGTRNYTSPTIYVALSTDDPLDDASGMAEPAALDGYLRVETAAADWDVAAAGALDNANAITFPEATGDWGTISHFALFDDTRANGGNMLAHGELSVHKAVGVGDTAKFAAGDLDVTLD